MFKTIDILALLQGASAAAEKNTDNSVVNFFVGSSRHAFREFAGETLVFTAADNHREIRVGFPQIVRSEDWEIESKGERQSVAAYLENCLRSAIRHLEKFNSLWYRFLQRIGRRPEVELSDVLTLIPGVPAKLVVAPKRKVQDVHAFIELLRDDLQLLAQHYTVPGSPIGVARLRRDNAFLKQYPLQKIRHGLPSSSPDFLEHLERHYLKNVRNIRSHPEYGMRLFLEMAMTDFVRAEMRRIGIDARGEHAVTTEVLELMGPGFGTETGGLATSAQAAIFEHPTAEVMVLIIAIPQQQSASNIAFNHKGILCRILLQAALFPQNRLIKSLRSLICWWIRPQQAIADSWLARTLEYARSQYLWDWLEVVSAVRHGVQAFIDKYPLTNLPQKNEKLRELLGRRSGSVATYATFLNRHLHDADEEVFIPALLFRLIEAGWAPEPQLLKATIRYYAEKEASNLLISQATIHDLQSIDRRLVSRGSGYEDSEVTAICIEFETLTTGKANALSVFPSALSILLHICTNGQKKTSEAPSSRTAQIIKSFALCLMGHEINTVDDLKSIRSMKTEAETVTQFTGTELDGVISNIIAFAKGRRDSNVTSECISSVQGLVPSGERHLHFSNLCRIKHAPLAFPKREYRLTFLEIFKESSWENDRLVAPVSMDIRRVFIIAIESLLEQERAREKVTANMAILEGLSLKLLEGDKTRIRELIYKNSYSIESKTTAEIASILSEPEIMLSASENETLQEQDELKQTNAITNVKLQKNEERLKRYLDILEAMYWQEPEKVQTYRKLKRNRSSISNYLNEKFVRVAFLIFAAQDWSPGNRPKVLNDEIHNLIFDSLRDTASSNDILTQNLNILVDLEIDYDAEKVRKLYGHLSIKMIDRIDVIGKERRAPLPGTVSDSAQ